MFSNREKAILVHVLKARGTVDTATEGDLALPITDEEAAAAINAAVAEDDFDATA